MSRRLTLNLGLRYELSPPAVDANDAIANYDLDSDPANPRIVLAGEEGRDLASRALQGINYGQLAPRGGFAYRLPGDKTVLRGGAGIFYANMITVGGMSSMEINPPNHLRISQTTDRTVPSIFLSQGFAANALVPASARDVTLVSYDRRNKVPTAYQWNVNLQRELPGRVLLEVGYNANRFVNNWRSIDGNPAPPASGNINSRRLYRTAVVPTTGDVITLSNVTRIQKDGWSQYRALQTKLEKRYAKGVSLLASAHLFDGPGSLEGGYQDPNNIAAEEGPASTDRPHYFVASGVYDLPFGRHRRIGGGWNGLTDAVLGGWSISPIVTFNSGDPLDLTVNGNPSNSSGTDRPNVVGDWQIDNPTASRWFNTDAFVANAPYTFGNSAQSAPRPRLRESGCRAPQVVPVVGQGQRRSSLRIVQRHQPGELRQPDYAGGQSELRAHLFGGRVQEQSGRDQASVLRSGPSSQRTYIVMPSLKSSIITLLSVVGPAGRVRAGIRAPFVRRGVRREQAHRARGHADEGRVGESARVDLRRCRRQGRKGHELGGRVWQSERAAQARPAEDRLSPGDEGHRQGLSCKERKAGRECVERDAPGWAESLCRFVEQSGCARRSAVGGASHNARRVVCGIRRLVHARVGGEALTGPGGSGLSRDSPHA